MNRRKLRTALLGCGGIHVMHAQALAQIEDVELAVVCDNKKERADASAARYGAEAAYDIDAVLARPDIDVVHLCLPHYLHASVAIKALQAGKWVLSEKPMATSLEDAQAMIAAGDAVGGKLGVIFQNRYNESSRVMRELIASGKFGALRGLRGMVNWVRDMDYYSDDWHGRKALEGGGVMMNQAIHTLDLMQWVSGKQALRVAGHVENLSLPIEVEDTAAFRVEFTDGVVGIFYATVAYVEDMTVELEAVLEGGTLLLRGDRLYQLDDDGELQPLVTAALLDSEGKACWGMGHQTQIADFYRSIGEGCPIAIDGRQGFPALAIIQTLYKASASGKPLDIPAVP